MDNNKSEELNFIGAEKYMGGYKEISFREIILFHLKNIYSLASKEWRGGYWQDRIKIVGGMSYKEHYYVEDSREAYSNAVDHISDLLSPHFDKEIKEEEEQLNKELEDLQKKFKEEQKFRDKKVQNRRKLFRALNHFLKRKDYIAGVTFETEE